MRQRDGVRRRSGPGVSPKSPNTHYATTPTQQQEIVKKFVKGDGSKLSKEEVQNRLVSRFVNEAVFSLQVRPGHASLAAAES